MLRVVTLGVLVCAIVLVASLIFGGDSGHKYTLKFQTAGSIVPGNLVMVGGHPIGSVDSVELTDDNLVAMNVTLDDPLHEDSTAVVRKSSLSSVAGHYVSITPGPDNAPELDDGATLSESQTTSAVELDQFFDIFDKSTRKGLSDLIQGVAATYAGDAAEGGNETFKYTGTAFSSTQRLFAELSDQDSRLEDFLKNTSGLVTTLADEKDTLTDLVSNSNTALGTIAEQNESLSLALQELPPTLRQANTTFVNLRLAVDDLEPLVAASGRAADAGLAKYLKKDLRPVLIKARPVAANLATASVRPGPNNDASDLESSLIPLQRVGEPAVNAAIGGLDASQEDVSESRAFGPDIWSGFANLNAVTGYYDANGQYARVTPIGSSLYQLNGNAIQPATTFNYGGYDFINGITRCPGGSTQPIAGSNPFLDNGNLVGKCNPGQTP